MQNVQDLKSPIQLITDGGPENKMNDLPLTINHKVALVDIHYSNSLIEAHNKILKYNYLYKVSIKDGHQLDNIFQNLLNDFNNRPHVSLKGRTPNEACENMKLDQQELTNYIRLATGRKENLQQNPPVWSLLVT